jgi:hypothetical protein
MNGEQKIEELKDPKEVRLVIKTTSLLISRIHKEKDSDEFKIAALRFFDVNNPHKQQVFPRKVLKYTNTEKIRLMGLNVSYYLEGNDIVVNDLEEVEIVHEGNALYLKGKQKIVERRK